MGIGRFIEFEALRNLRLDDTLHLKIEQLLDLAADAVCLAPKVPQWLRQPDADLYAQPNPSYSPRA